MNEDLAAWFEHEIMIHASGLRGFISRSVESWDPGASEASDILQEVYMKVWADAASMREQCRSPKAYVYQVARNLLIDKARRRNILCLDYHEDPQSLNPLIDHITPERAASDQEHLERLKRCFDKLPHRRREAVRLVRIEGRSQKEAATRMKITAGTLEQTFQNAIRQLADCLDSGDPEADAPASRGVLSPEKKHGK